MAEKLAPTRFIVLGLSVRANMKVIIYKLNRKIIPIIAKTFFTIKKPFVACHNMLTFFICQIESYIDLSQNLLSDFDV